MEGGGKRGEGWKENLDMRVGIRGNKEQLQVCGAGHCSNWTRAIKLAVRSKVLVDRMYVITVTFQQQL